MYIFIFVLLQNNKNVLYDQLPSIKLIFDSKERYFIRI